MNAQQLKEFNHWAMNSPELHASSIPRACAEWQYTLEYDAREDKLRAELTQAEVQRDRLQWLLFGIAAAVAANAIAFVTWGAFS